MFSLLAVTLSTKHRASDAHWLAEVVATVGLLLVIFALARTGRGGTAPAVTSSTSFANPAITVGRMFSNTFAGIAPSSVLGYVIAEVLGGGVVIAVIKALYPSVTPREAAEVVLPHLDAHSQSGTRSNANGSAGTREDEPSARDR